MEEFEKVIIALAAAICAELLKFFVPKIETGSTAEEGKTPKEIQDDIFGQIDRAAAEAVQRKAENASKPPALGNQPSSI